MNKVYYMDGYHGGIRGHMPLGCWRDILDALRRTPDWKLSIDIEPVSWDYLRERDPQSYAELTELLRDGTRVEIVAGSYAQPYGWITDGESNLRHLLMGRKITRKHFPFVTVDTYAVQEPCWTSALPQMLRQLGYRRASLKDASTAWGGYCEGYPASIVDWTGPDGTSIPTIPRYSCEDLKEVFYTEARDASPEWLEKCEENGIPCPTGMYFQDLGWHANPGVRGDHIEFSLIRDYFTEHTPDTIPAWQPGQEIFRGALPWGDHTLVKMARQVRRGETALLDTERLCAIASLYGMENPEARLNEAWGHLLMTQHHDGWICACAGFGENNWAWKTSAQIYAAEFITDQLKRQAFASAASSADAGNSDSTVTVFHPLARREKRLIRVPITAEYGTRSIRVYDGETLLPSQLIPERRHGDGSFNAGELLFAAEPSPLGMKNFTIRFAEEEVPAAPEVSAAKQDGLFLLENGFYRIVIDPAHGGVITSFFDKHQNAEIVPEGAYFNELKGFFIEENRFCSNTEHPAECKIEYAGDLEAVLTVRGKIAGSGYRMQYIVRADSPALDVRVSFHFARGTHIGEPYEMKCDGHDPHRTYHDGRYRLNAYFPTVFPQRYLDKDCAYDVCRSRLDNTHFKTWEEIKHNILLHWADTSDGNCGLSVMADHTTAYIHGGGCSFGLALAWGYDGGFWWGRRTLEGEHTLRYSILSHAGTWREADLWHECEKFLHQPIARPVIGTPRECSAFEILTENVHLGAFLYENGGYTVRVFNAGDNHHARFRSGVFTKMQEITPDGTQTGRILSCTDGCFEGEIPPFGIRSYRLTV